MRLDRFRGHVDPPIDPELRLSVHEAAVVADVSDGTILNWAKAGKLPFTRTPGGHRRFRLADVEAAIA